MSRNLSELSGRKGLKKNLFEELGKAAAGTGTPDQQKLEEIRNEFLIGKSSVYGTVSFYDFLKPENKGKKAYVCNGSACLLAGTQDAVRHELEKHFKSDEIGEMCCLGRCHENHAFHVHGKNYSGKDLNGLSDVISKKNPSVEILHSGGTGQQILTASYGTVESFYTIFSDCLKKDKKVLIEELKQSGLRGRGGAGFPMGFKLESCMNTPGNEKYIVCNADEGDPGAFSDRYIMEQRPHSLLMGMMIAAYIAGASRGVLYIRGEYPESVEVISEAIEDLRSRKLIGENILNSGFNFEF